MGYFPDTIAAKLAGRVVQMVPLAFFDFATTPMRLWSGFGPLVAGGETWSGLGEFGSISGIESALGETAPETTFTLSGVDKTLIAAALANSAEVKGRDVTVYLQFFDATWRALDNPYAIALLTMDVMKVQSTGTDTRTVELTAETIWTQRGTAPWAYLSDRNQQARFPGDGGLDQVAAMQNKSIDWPVYG